MNSNRKEVIIIAAKRLFLSILLILAVFALQGCSMRGVLFNFAETLSVMWLDQMFDLSREQKVKATVKVDMFFAWLKAEKKEPLVNNLTELKKNWRDGLNEEEVEAFRRGLSSTLGEVGDKLGELFAPLAGSLTDEQIENFSEYLEESNEERLELLASKNYEDERKQQLRENTETWYGEITDAQLESIVEFSRGKEGLSKYLMQRKAAQHYVVSYLSSHRNDPPKIAKLFKQFSRAPEMLRPQEMQKEFLTMRNQWSGVWAKTDALMTPRQRQIASRYLDAWIEDIKEF